VELVKHQGTKEPFRRQGEKYARTVITEIAAYLLEEKNIYIPADKFGLWIVPPLVVTQDEIDFLVAAIDDALCLADARVIS
jgi:taurine--2-oxoglutarate transaminase